MNKLKIRITRFNTQAKKGKFFHDVEETIFLHEAEEDKFFALLEAIGKVNSYEGDKAQRKMTGEEKIPNVIDSLLSENQKD